MQPALKDVVGKWAEITPWTFQTFFDVWALNASVFENTRVSTTRFLTGMRKGTHRPVVAIVLGARQHLEAVHSEFVRVVEGVYAPSGRLFLFDRELWHSHSFTRKSRIEFDRGPTNQINNSE